MALCRSTHPHVETDAQGRHVDRQILVSTFAQPGSVGLTRRPVVGSQLITDDGIPVRHGLVYPLRGGQKGGEPCTYSARGRADLLGEVCDASRCFTPPAVLACLIQGGSYRADLKELQMQLGSAQRSHMVATCGGRSSGVVWYVFANMPGG